MSANQDPVMVLRLANSLTDLLAVCKIDPIVNDNAYTLQVYGTNDLSIPQREAIFALFETNMKDLYTATWGYNREEKRKELFHPMSRFLCVEKEGEKEGEEGGKEIVAYTIFRFEWDDEEEPEHPVVYCYELHVSSAYQKQSLGKQLMNHLLSMQKKLKLWKVMLTCFTANTGAMGFYTSCGFGVDCNSPSRCGFPTDYEILSNEPDAN